MSGEPLGNLCHVVVSFLLCMLSDPSVALRRKKEARSTCHLRTRNGTALLSGIVPHVNMAPRPWYHTDKEDNIRPVGHWYRAEEGQALARVV